MTRTTDVRSNHARVTAMRGHGFEVNVMKYLFLLLLLAAQPMVAVLAAATLPPALASAESVAESPAELTLIKEEACAVLAAPNEIETIVTPRGPGFVFTTVGGKGQVEIVARPSFQAWRVPQQLWCAYRWCRYFKEPPHAGDKRYSGDLAGASGGVLC